MCSGRGSGLGKTLLVRTLGARSAWTLPDQLPRLDARGCHRHHRGGRNRAGAFFGTGVVPSLRSCCWRMKSTGQRPRPSRRCWRRCKNAGHGGGVTHELPAPFMVMATQTPLSRKGHIPCQKPNWTGSCSSDRPHHGREDLVEILRRTTGAARTQSGS